MKTFPQNRDKVYQDHCGCSFSFDDKDQEILDRRMQNRNAFSRPLVGDYVIFPTGEVERFAHDWDTALQTAPKGSFFLCENGKASFSGGLNPTIPIESLTLTEEMKDGVFWFFHHNYAGAGRATYVTVPCRVYVTSAPYDGFLR